MDKAVEEILEQDVKLLKAINNAKKLNDRYIKRYGLGAYEV